MMASTKESSALPARRRRVRKKSFTEALREKYCFEEEDMTNFVVKIVVFGKPRNNKNSEAELGHLKNVVLNNSKVACAGLPQTGLATLCPNVVDLDLSSNFLDSWRETLPILAQLPNLSFINLSHNKLKNEQCYLQDWKHKLVKIENVVLNSTDLTWEDVLSLTSHLPDLKELHLCNNGYDKLPEDGNLHGLQGVEYLRLNNNNFKSWSEIWKLRHLPKLKHLILSGNPLEDVFYCKSDIVTTLNDENVTSEREPAYNNTTAFMARSTILDELFVRLSDQKSLTHDRNQSTQNTEHATQDTNISMDCGDFSHNAAAASVNSTSFSESMMGGSTNHYALHISMALLDEVIHSVCQNAESLRENSETDRVTSPVNMEVSDLRRPMNGCSVCKMRQDLQAAVQITVVNSGYLERDNYSLVANQEACSGHMMSKLNHVYAESPANGGTKTCDKINCDKKTNDEAGKNTTIFQMADKTTDQTMDIQHSGTPSVQSRQPFSQLNSLCLSQTCVSLWEHLYAFSDFPSLKSLRVMGIPLVSEQPQEEKRKLHLACLPTIQILNGGEVTLTEREKAERHFVRFFIDKTDRPDRYHDLERKHGKLSPLVDIDLNRGFQEWVTVKYVHHGIEVHQGKIHVTEPVGKLRQFVCRTLGEQLGIWGFRMWHLASGPCHEEEETELQELFLDSLPMSRFDILDGDEIHIEELR